ncbi:cation diffusion facilitator family transporter [Acidisphaera sp. S103]|uniref:cation diffusion facilitator family transporter n=1 Tax=Acidisphaera sp. S103 TaxID=1747223 RepID=UPI00131D26B6|nr:cation diffusion facilitator family transporter [Acidisphaera sp. S103]
MHQQSGLRRFASRTSLAVAVTLVAVKLTAWVLTGSVALLASAIDALVDTGASLATYYGVRYAERPPDEDHRFGHGKGEAIAGFTQATFLAGAAVVLAFQSLQRLFFPRPTESLQVGAWVIAGSLVAATALVTMQTWVVKKTGSTAIAADRAHYMTDIALNAGVLLALGVTRFTGWQRADPSFALAISGYMLWNAYHIATQALTQLLDRELPTADRQKITNAVRACAGVRDIHDLRTRYAGDRIFVEFHLEVDEQLTVKQGHAIGDVAETAVVNLLPGVVEVTAHLEPFGIDDDRLDDRVMEIT